VPTGDRLPGSTLDARETDSCWTMRWSVAFLVLQHDSRISIGTREGAGRVLECLVGAAGTWTDRGGACKGGEWRTEEERKGGADDRDRVVDSAGGGATGWLREPSWVYACAVCGPLPEEGNMVHSTPVPEDNGQPSDPVVVPKMLRLWSSLLLLVARALLNSPSGIGIRPTLGMSSIGNSSSSVLCLK